MQAQITVSHSRSFTPPGLRAFAGVSPAAPCPAPADFKTWGQLAQKGDADAVSRLIHLSAGVGGEPASATEAEAELLRVYRESSSEIRADIVAQCAKAWEMCCTDRPFSASPSPLPVGVLFLAGRRVQALAESAPRTFGHAYRELSQKVGSLANPHAAIFSPVDDYLSASRFVSQDELLPVAEKLQSLTLSPTVLRPDDAGGFMKGVRQLIGPLEPGNPKAAFFNVSDMHWQVAFFCRRDDSDRVDVVIFDSMRDPVAEINFKRQAQLAAALGHRMGQVLEVGGVMQRHAVNACGPLSVMALETADELLHHGRGVAGATELAQAIQNRAVAWGHLPPQEQEETALGIRAQLVSRLHTGR